MIKIKDINYTLSNGIAIPCVGFGTWQTKDGEEAYNSVIWALRAGYRHIDTAYAYGNEESVGKAIRNSNVNREDIFITTKLPAEIKGYEQTIDYFNRSLKLLDSKYIDLYLIHAPWPWSNQGMDCKEGNINSWKAMIDLYNSGRVKAIGVSNFNVEQIESLFKATNFLPMVNQIRFFIGNTQEAITNYCQENNILVEAYSPLATGELIDNEALLAIAKKHNTTIPKICLRYCIQRGTLPLPKSVHKDRINDNIEFDFYLDKDDMTYLNSLDKIASTRPFRS